MKKYKKELTGKIINENEYKNLPYGESSYYREIDDDGDFIMSAVIGAATDNSLIGGLLGGSIIGGILGDTLNDGDLF